MKKRTKQLIVLVLSIVVIIGSITYALWSRSRTQEVANRVKSGCFDVEITMDDRAIELDNTYPIIDEEGLELTPYTVTLKNTCTIGANYNINLNILNESDMDYGSVKVGVNDDARLLTNYSYNDEYDEFTYQDSYILASGDLRANEETKNGESVTYNIRVWMDEDAPRSEAEKEFLAKISVETIPTTIPDPGKLDGKEFHEFTIDYHWRRSVEVINTVLTNEVPNNAIDSRDISISGNGEVMAWYLDEDLNGMYELFIGSPHGILVSNFIMFDGYSNVKLIDVKYLDVSNVTEMGNMFNNASVNATTFEIKGLENWDVSNVTYMGYMFCCTGLNSSRFTIKGLETWDVSNVTNMQNMFYHAGQNATEWNIGDISNWDVSNVTTMYAMFALVGQEADNTLDLTAWRNKVSPNVLHTDFNQGTSLVLSPFDE